MTKPLVVYKASAGSGKTFTLAAEYIALLVRNPQSYRQILAVTFTNKATEEMKTRILSQLYGISHGHRKSQPYVDFVCRKLGYSPQQVSRQADIALHNLLHNYSYFRVETIDSFFQSVLRNMARELDLTANLRIGLNDVQVEEMAVDQLIESLSASDAVLKWLMRYIMDNISDDRSWNVIGQIKKFGLTIFRDYYKRESKTLHQVVAKPGFFDDYTATLRAIRQKAEAQMKAYGQDFDKQLQSEGLSADDFAYGHSGVAGFFEKLANGQFDPGTLGKRVVDCIGQPQKWYKKTHPRAELLQALAEGPLDQLLRHAVDDLPQQWKLYQSATLTLRHLSQLRLLSNIEQKVHDINESANRFLLSDTQQLLHELIEYSDSPFIFEKIGTQLEHIMIDEFQDTSTVQWQNFKVLLQEIMSHQLSENLIVGDVKQSIYRWRSGDWQLLAGIDSQFAHPEEQIDIVPLKYNYRSCSNIVGFNNDFFAEAAKIEEVAAYDDVRQEVPAGKSANEGLVEIELLPATDDYQEQMLERTAAVVERLLAEGVATNDIAILVRTNLYIPLIANYFMERLPDVQIVSDEAFRLDASPAVLTIIQAMRLLATPANAIAKAYLAKRSTDEPLHHGDIDSKLPDDFAQHTEELRRLPLYELAERLYTIFGLGDTEGQSAYLCAFYDQIAAYVNDKAADLNDFLAEWDETICAKTIQSPEIDGIRIVSIHKSKGLEFNNVIVPFCDWKLEHSDILWCKPTEQPFCKLPLVPVDYSQKQMEGTIYETFYQEEHMQTMVDNLNLLYVAFTRASHNLFVMGKRKAKSSRSALLEQTLPKLMELPTMQQATLVGLEGDEKQDSIRFALGRLALPHAKEQAACGEPEPNVFTVQPTPIKLNIETFEQKVVFRQSNKSRDFAANPGEADAESTQQAGYIQLGNVLHNVFSMIRTASDVDQALQQLEFEGILYDDNISRQKLEDMIRKRLADSRVADWFSDRWTLYNECTILSIDQHTGQVYERRPDRVMANAEEMIVVDFKFGHPRDEYRQQVGEYMQLLRDMGHHHVSGYLWYVYSNKIEQVL